MKVMSVNRLAVSFDEKKIDWVFSEVDQCHLPGLAAGVAIQGMPVYRKGFGLASMDLPVALSSTVRMRIGSVSKHFAALAYLRLCEAGRAGIDDSIGKHLPELHPVTHKVTMRQLMGNNSGLRDATDLCLQFSGAEGKRVSTDDLLSFYCGECTANAPPGVTHIYNNAGWIILSVVMERIARKPLEEILWKEVFEPIGMVDTLLRRWDAEFVTNSASAHAPGVDGKFERTEMVGGLDYVGAGSIASTVDDMLLWLAHMDAPKIGSTKTWELMKTAQKLNNGTTTDYGMGLTHHRYRGVDMIWHSGGGFGSNAQMIKVPAAGLDVVVMSNRADKLSPAFAEKILEICLPDLEAPGEPYRGPSPEGVFRSPTTGRVVQLSRGDTGYYLAGEEVPIAAVDGHFFPIVPGNGGVLRPASEQFAEFNITLVGDPSAPSALQLIEFGTADELTAVKRNANPDLAKVAGRYRSAETGTEAFITATADGARLKFVGRFGSTEHALDYLAEGVWRNRILNRWIVPLWGFLVFDDDGAFGFYTYLTRNVRFARVS